MLRPMLTCLHCVVMMFSVAHSVMHYNPTNLPESIVWCKVNYDVANNAEDYVHRIGRTGQFSSDDS